MFTTKIQIKYMETIAKNNFYEIHYNSKKNRVYYKIKGFWSCDAVTNYKSDIISVSNFVRPNFTMIVDTTQMEVHPVEIEELRIWAQGQALEYGMLMAAQILSTDFISGLQFDNMTEQSKFMKGKFTNIEQAEEWLDKYEQEHKK